MIVKTDYELYQQIKNNLINLDMGITPIQLFKTPHPDKIVVKKNNFDFNNISRNKTFNLNNSRISINNFDNNSDKDNNSDENNINSIKNKTFKHYSEIKDFTLKQNATKYKIFLNESTMNIFFIFDNKIIIYNIINSLKGDATPLPKINYPVELGLKNKLINLEYDYWDISRNIIAELIPGFYCICRNDNRTIKFVDFTQKYYFSYLWTSIITAIEPFHCLNNAKSSEYDYTWNIFFGDEEGFLCVLKCLYEYIFNNNEFKLNKIEIIKKIKIHGNCINNIIYIKRLGIVISSSLEGDISINNAESLEILNYIKLGEKYLINDIKISIYDLIYVGCYKYKNKNYYIKCYTINGIKATKMKSKIKIINFFINDYLNVLYENRMIDTFCVYDFKIKETTDINKILAKEERRKDSIFSKFNILNDKLIIIFIAK